MKEDQAHMTMRYDQLMTLFGKNLRSIRYDSLGLTQKELSGLTGVSASTISLLEQGVIGCTVKTLHALCDACGADVTTMLK